MPEPVITAVTLDGKLGELHAAIGKEAEKLQKTLAEVNHLNTTLSARVRKYEEEYVPTWVAGVVTTLLFAAGMVLGLVLRK